MKKNFSFTNMTVAMLFTTPLLLTGCQAIEGLFSDSPQRSYEQTHHTGSYGRATSNSQSNTTSTSSSTSTGKRTSTITPAKGTQSSTSSVPIEPPTVPTMVPTTTTQTTSKIPAATSGTTTPPSGMAPPAVNQ